MLISDKYREMNQHLHDTKETYGRSGKKYVPTILAMRKQHETMSVLDYGCGKGTLGDNILGVTNYDPVTFPDAPEPHDIVVCTDVLEHVEPECLSDVLADIARLTIKAGFLTIATRPAKKELPNGRNAHLIIRSAGWWVDTLLLFFDVSQLHINKDNGDIMVFVSPKEAP